MTVLLRVGDWSREIEVEDFPHSFIHDWYHDVGKEGEDELRVDSMTFLPEQWDKLMLLHERDGDENLKELMSNISNWSQLSPATQAYVATFHRNTTPIIRYSEVKESLFVMGGRTEEGWSLLVLLEESDDPIERYAVNQKRGELLRLGGGKYNYDVIQSYIASLVLSSGSKICERVGEDYKQVVSDSIIGILHNGFLSNDAGVLVDWAYIVWEDLLLLCKKVNVDTSILSKMTLVLARGSSLETSDLVSWVWDDCFDFMNSYLDMGGVSFHSVICESSTPILYWRLMNGYREDRRPREIGIEAFTREILALDTIDRDSMRMRESVRTKEYAAIVNHMSSWDVTKSLTRGTHRSIPVRLVDLTIKYMREQLGLLAMAKIYLILHNHHTIFDLDSTNPFLVSMEALMRNEGCGGDCSTYCRQLLSSYDLPRVRRILEEGDPMRLLLGRLDRRPEEEKAQPSCCTLL